MRHLNRGRKLKRTSSHKKALLRGLATSLFEHKKISTTEAKAKELRPYAEHLITKAKHALQREKQGLLPEGQTIDIHNRRIVFKHIKVKAVVQELFDTIAPLVADRPGGYTRIIKTGQRRGDGSRTAIIELVDWSAPQDGATSFKSKKKTKSKAKVSKKELKPITKTEETKPVVIEEIETAISEEVVTEVAEESVVVSEVQDEIVAESAEETVIETQQENIEEKPTEEENKESKE